MTKPRLFINGYGVADVAYDDPVEEVIGTVSTNGDTLQIDFSKYRYIRVCPVINGSIPYNGMFYHPSDFDYTSNTIYFSVYQSSSYNFVGRIKKTASDELTFYVESLVGWSSSTFVKVIGVF